MKPDEITCKLNKNMTCLHENDSVSHMEYKQSEGNINFKIFYFVF